MVEQKKKNVAAALLAVASAFLLLGISYILFLDQTPQQPSISKSPLQPETLLDQIFWAIQWIGLAAVIAITAVGAILIITQIKRKKTPKLH